VLQNQFKVTSCNNDNANNITINSRALFTCGMNRITAVSLMRLATGARRVDELVMTADVRFRQEQTMSLRGSNLTPEFLIVTGWNRTPL